MGVDATAYTIYGIKIKFDDDLAEEVGDNEDPHVLMDGMCGNYMILGPVLFSCDVYEGEEGDLTQHTFEQLVTKWEKWEKKFRTKYPKFVKYLDKAPRIISLVHYS